MVGTGTDCILTIKGFSLQNDCYDSQNFNEKNQKFSLTSLSVTVSICIIKREANALDTLKNH